MAALEEQEIHVVTGNKIMKSGYYVYEDHYPKDDKTSGNCFVANKAKSGLYLAEGSLAPDLGSCSHKVMWRLVR